MKWRSIFCWLIFGLQVAAGAAFGLAVEIPLRGIGIDESLEGAPILVPALESTETGNLTNLVFVRLVVPRSDIETDFDRLDARVES